MDDVAQRLQAFIKERTDRTLSHAIHAPASKPSVEGMRDLCVGLVEEFFKAENSVKNI